MPSDITATTAASRARRVASPFRLYAPEVIFVGGGPVFAAVGCALVYVFVFG